MSQAIAPAVPLSSSRKPAWWMLLGVALLAALVYFNSLKNEFAFDDVAVVQNNPHVLDLEWTTIWTDNYWPKIEGVQPDALYRPLTLWTYVANQAIAPGNTMLFHLVNVVLHALVSVLVAQLTWRLLGDRWAAALAGLLFAVHPIHTEAVANTVGRAELLAALWSLLALLVFLPEKPLLEETAPTRRSIWHGGLVAVCFLAAILCKETPAALLLGFVVIDAWRWSRWSRETRPTPVRWFLSQFGRYYLPLGAAMGLYLALRIPACGLVADTAVIHHVVNPLVDATIPERIVTPFLLLAKYLWLTFWPAQLSSDYSLPSLPATANPLHSMAALGILTIALTGIVCVRSWRSRPQLLLTVGLFFSSYFLVSNVIRIGTIFGERLFYWPSAFVLMLIAWGAVGAYRQWIHGRAMAARLAAAVLLLAVTGAMGARTWVRNTDWANNIALAIATGRDNPMSGKACNWAGSTLLAAGPKEYEAFGLSLIERAIELSPDYVTARWELAKYYGYRGKLGESLVAMSHAARIDAGTYMTSKALTAIAQDLQKAAPESYMAPVEKALKDNPEDECAWFSLAMAQQAQGKLAEAEINARKALDITKRVRKDGFDQFHEAAALLARVKLELGKPKEATEMYRKYATIMRNSVSAHCNFAMMLVKLDPEEFPEAWDEAEYNLKVAEAIDRKAPQIRKAREAFAAAKAARDPVASAAEASRVPEVEPKHPRDAAGGTP